MYNVSVAVDYCGVTNQTKDEINKTFRELIEKYIQDNFDTSQPNADKSPLFNVQAWS